MIERFHIRNRYFLIIDIVLITVSVILSFVFRLEIRQILVDYLPTLSWMLAVALLVKPLAFYWFGLYRRFWAYASTKEAITISGAVTITSIIVAGIMFTLWGFEYFEFFPRSIPIIDWMVSLLLIGGIRFLPRLLTEGLLSNSHHSDDVQVLVVGAGDAGALVVRELQKNLQLNLNPIGFLDDDEEKQNYQIHGIKVVGTLSEIHQVIENNLVDEVIIAIPSAPGQVVRQVADACRQKNIPFRTMPGIYELIGGIVSVNRLREVEIEDLLRREHAAIDDRRIGHFISGKCILITGAGGSIAGELCRQIARWGPSEMILVGHGENSIFEIMLEFEKNVSNVPIHPVIADVRDEIRLAQVIQRYTPQIIFHAAAHKHVSLMEKNVEEAITNNILGTRNIVNIAKTNQVERLVMISTDKAVRPTSVMGATKRIAEMVVLDAARKDNLAYSIVRFGNVLGSRGSVVPIFKQQIARGGPITVTHPDVERFFMTIPEAVHLVLQAFALGEGGEVFLLDMGQPVKIAHLAKDLIRLSGLEPGQDIEITYTGLKTGEKLSEELWDSGVPTFETDHPEITKIAEDDFINDLELDVYVENLIQLAQNGEAEKVVKILDEIIPGANIQGTPPPDLTSV